MVRVLVLLALSGAACRLYVPEVRDCRLRCGLDGACPVDTTCVEGMCRLPGATDRCECSEGDARPCGAVAGLCAGTGVQRCEGHRWLDCAGATPPSEEACNGLDDDCDGQTDENVAQTPACPLTLGVCRGAVQRCLNASFAPCGAAEYGPRWERTEQACDGLDNDCDGETDSSLALPLTTARTGPWWFLSRGAGTALVVAEGGELAVQWRGVSLALQASTRVVGGEGLQVAAQGETVRLAWRSDAGLELRALTPDGGLEVRVVTDVARFSLSGGALALVGLEGTLALSPFDGGAPLVLGADDGGALLFSELGAALSWSGGLTRTDDGALLHDGGLGDFLALVERSSGGLGGLRPALPDGGWAYVPDVTRDLTALPLPAPVGLRSVHATGYLDALLVAGLAPNGTLQLVDRRGRTEVALPGGADEVQLARGTSDFTPLAWSRGGTVWGLERCAP